MSTPYDNFRQQAFLNRSFERVPSKEELEDEGVRINPKGWMIDVDGDIYITNIAKLEDLPKAWHKLFCDEDNKEEEYLGIVDDIEGDLQKCIKCGRELGLEAFDIDARTKDGKRRRVCKECAQSVHVAKIKMMGSTTLESPTKLNRGRGMDRLKRLVKEAYELGVEHGKSNALEELPSLKEILEIQ